MCYAVACRKCGKTTWSGCGQHVDQVMRGVPAAQRCQGHQGEKRYRVLREAVRTMNAGDLGQSRVEATTAATRLWSPGH